MASLSNKRIAKTNVHALKELHLASIIVNLLAISSYAFLNRPSYIWMYVLFSLPAGFCQYTLERRGRPLVIDGKHKTIDDIKGPGLYEYMFDCIYITWFCTILMVLFGSNKAWIVYLVIPGFSLYKLIGIFRSFLLPGRDGPIKPTENTSGKRPQSKRASSVKVRT